MDGDGIGFLIFCYLCGWIAVECGDVHDRDINAAKNILRVALECQRPAEGIRTDIAETLSRTITRPISRHAGRTVEHE